MHRTIPYLLPFLLVTILAACGGKNGSRTGTEAGGTLAQAVHEVDQRIIADPRNAALFAERALLNEQRDSLHLALNDWNRAITLDSANASHHLGLGDLYFRKVRLMDAERHLRRAATLDNNSPDARLKLAELKLLQREHTEAMGWANDALRIDKQHARGYYLKGWIHMEAGDTALAVSSYRTAIEQDPSMVDAFLQLGVLHAEKRDPLAMQYYNSALEIQPANTKALYALGMFAQENGMDSLALKCYARIKEIDPENVLAYYNTGYILLEHLREPEAARTEFSQVIDMAPQFTEAHYNRGVAYELQGRLDSAYLDYRRTLEVRPDYTAAAEAIGRLRSKGVRVTR
jgi:tetratricopeptide (TPR) repeat protein